MKFFMMVGLPGSGKSTYATKLAEENDAVIFSSDDLRLKLFGDENDQTHNEDVFRVLADNTVAYLCAGKNVIYDATNISSKYRIQLLQRLIKIPNCEKIAVFVATPLSMCIKRNAHRERVVPEHAIFRMYKSFNPPTIHEGFDDVRVVYPENVKFKNEYALVKSMSYLSHDNPHHKDTIGDHMFGALEYFTNEAFIPESLDLDNYEILRYAILLHDIGKPAVKAFRDGRGQITEDAHYFGHQNVGAYEVFFTDIPENMKLDVSLLICHHMDYYIGWKQSKKAEKKGREFLGPRLSSLLDILHECDLNAH